MSNRKLAELDLLHGTIAQTRKVNKLKRIIRNLLVICELAGHTGEPPSWVSNCDYCADVRKAKKEIGEL